MRKLTQHNADTETRYYSSRPGQLIDLRSEGQAGWTLDTGLVLTCCISAVSAHMMMMEDLFSEVRAGPGSAGWLVAAPLTCFKFTGVKQ